MCAAPALIGGILGLQATTLGQNVRLDLSSNFGQEITIIDPGTGVTPVFTLHVDIESDSPLSGIQYRINSSDQGAFAHTSTVVHGNVWPAIDYFTTGSEAAPGRTLTDNFTEIYFKFPEINIPLEHFPGRVASYNLTSTRSLFAGETFEFFLGDPIEQHNGLIWTIHGHPEFGGPAVAGMNVLLTVIPEPSTGALLMASLLIARRRRV